MRSGRIAVLAASVTASLLVVGAPALAKGGEVGGSGDQYYLTNGWDASTDGDFVYGRALDQVYVGDWDGDGQDTLAVRRDAAYYFSNGLAGGGADRVVTYGRSTDTVLMGDWDGDGVDTPAVRRGDEYLVKNSLRGGAADLTVTYGRSTDVVLVGDWDGDGVDTLGVRRGDTYYLKNSMSGGPADVVVTYGREGDEVIVGDWDGDGEDTLGVRRRDSYFIKNTIAGGPADRVMRYGRPADAALVGDWDGNGSDTIGVRRERPGQTPLPGQGGLTEYDARMVELVNEERADAGVAPLRAWPALRDGALRHSRWMGRTGNFVHASETTIRNDGIAAGCDASAENIFWGSRGYVDDPEAAVDAYMNSPGHRASILDPNNRYFAAGTDQADNGRVYNTQRFARSCS